MICRNARKPTMPIPLARMTVYPGVRPMRAVAEARPHPLVACSADLE